MRSLGLAQAAVYGLIALYHGWRVPTTASWIDDAVAWATAIALFLLYRSGYRQVSQSDPAVPLRQIVLYACPLVLISAVTVPFDSSDAFLYLAMARAQAQYGLNPYTDLMRTIVPDITLDPAIGAQWMSGNYNPWLDLPLVYGFFFANLLRLVGWAANGSWWIALLLIKLVNVAAYALTAGILWACTRHLGEDRHPGRTLYLFMWSPLVLIHEIANGHNDLLMGCLIAAAFYLILTGRLVWSVPVLVAAAMVKYLAILFVPMTLFVILRKRGVLQAVGSALAGVGVFVLLGFPYLGEFSRFQLQLIVAQMNKFTAGTLTGVLFYTYRSLDRNFSLFSGTLEPVGTALQIAMTILALSFLAGLTYWFFRSDLSTENMLWAWTAMLFVIMFLSPQFYAWYFGMLFPIALLLRGSDPLRELIVILSATHLASLPSIGSKALNYFILGTVTGLLWWGLKKNFIPPPRSAVPK